MLDLKPVIASNFGSFCKICALCICVEKMSRFLCSVHNQILIKATSERGETGSDVIKNGNNNLPIEYFLTNNRLKLLKIAQKPQNNCKK